MTDDKVGGELRALSSELMDEHARNVCHRGVIAIQTLRQRNSDLMESVHNCLKAAGAPDDLDELEKELGKHDLLKPGAKPSHYIVQLKERHDKFEARMKRLAFHIINHEGPVDDVWEEAQEADNKWLLKCFEDVGGLEAAQAMEDEIYKPKKKS